MTHDITELNLTTNSSPITQHHGEIQIEWMSKNMNEYNQIDLADWSLLP